MPSVCCCRLLCTFGHAIKKKQKNPGLQRCLLPLLLLQLRKERSGTRQIASPETDTFLSFSGKRRRRMERKRRSANAIIVEKREFFLLLFSADRLSPERILRIEQEPAMAAANVHVRVETMYNSAAVQYCTAHCNWYYRLSITFHHHHHHHHRHQNAIIYYCYCIPRLPLLLLFLNGD